MDKSSAEISQDIADSENELKRALDNAYILETEKLQLQRQIIGLQAQKKDVEIKLSKANHIIKELSIDIRLKTKSFWKVKNSGL